MASVFSRAIAAGVIVAFAVQSAAQAQTPLPKPPLQAPKPDGKPGSNFLQCDGQPRAIPAAEALMDVALISGSMGLFGLINPIENANVNKRLEGEAGVAACDRALAEDTTAIRRAQVVLARAIHRIEAKQYDAAIADLHTVAAAAGDKAAEPGFQESLGLSVMELEAAALLREGRTADAQHAAMAMAAAAPTDLSNMARAGRYLLLTADMTPEKAQFLDRYVRLMPENFTARASARELAGDFAGAADDMASEIDILGGVSPDQPPPVGPMVRRAVVLALTGDLAGSDDLAARTQAAIDAGMKKGKFTEANAAALEEQLDFRNIVVLAAKGQTAEARTLFKARSRWLAPWPMEVAALTAKLRAGAAPADLTGALARDPEVIKADALSAYAANAVAASVPDDQANRLTLYGAVRTYIDSGLYGTLRGPVWRAEKSRLLLARTGKETYQGETISLNGVTYGSLVPAGQGAILHAAVIAKARGVGGFIVAPGRQRLDVVVVRFGNAGDPGFPKAGFLDSGQVIAELSPKMPAPN